MTDGTGGPTRISVSLDGPTGGSSSGGRLAAWACLAGAGNAPPSWWVPITVSVLVVLLFGSTPPVNAQVTTRKATTISALLAYPVFFHGQRIAVRGTLMVETDRQTVHHDGASVHLFGLDRVSTGAAPSDRREVRGAFWDVGRLEASDPRLASHDVRAISMRTLGKEWPGLGELLAIVVEAVSAVELAPEATVRELALDPARYADQVVTVAGRFRGRNLFGDLPQSPGQSRWDFVLQSANGAIWATGKEPRGREFDLDLNARRDAGQWLEATGTVRAGRGLVWIEVSDLVPADPSTTADRSPETQTRVAIELDEPPPEVIFSTPLPDEVDVSREAPVRIQFSRAMAPESFRGRVRARYLDSESTERGEPEAPSLGIEIDYRAGNRVLTITFSTALDRFRTMKIDLLEGIESLDGTLLAPWTLTFSLGG